MTGALGRLLDDALSRNGEVRDELGQATSFASLHARAVATGDALRARGLASDEPVHVAIANRPADIAALLGVWRAGGVAVPVHVAAAAGTVARIAGLSKARFGVDGYCVSGLAAAAPPQRPLLRGAALVISTSGSTGLPKGVVLGHDRFASKLDVLDSLLRFTAADRVLLPLQLTFIFGIWVSLLALRAGAGLTLVSRFAPAALSRCLVEGTTVLAAVPSMLRTLLAQNALAGKGPRLLLAGGEALGTHLRGAVGRRWPATDLLDLYGLTETGSCDFHCRSAGDATRAGSIGRPTGGVAYRITDLENGGAAAQGEPGELQIRTPFGMLGYLDDAALSEASFGDGFFRTGDVARVGADGCVELVGRIKEIVSRGGNKIAPQEIDDLLSAHPGVAGALSAGVPHQRLGEAIYTVVVPKVGAELSSADLRQWLAQRIERFKLPDVISIEHAVPTGTTGKASRALLRETVIASGAAAAADT
ncbi:MAG: fatty acid--CoA ligase family protein [Rhodospirillales bacterium]|nr:fatty acid--CoA ligase family protein [Rhodospirillales bacterium]